MSPCQHGLPCQHVGDGGGCSDCQSFIPFDARPTFDAVQAAVSIRTAVRRDDCYVTNWVPTEDKAAVPALSQKVSK